MKAARLSSLTLVALAVALPLRLCLAQAPKPSQKTAAVNLAPSKLISVDFTFRGKPLPEALNQIAQAGGLAIIIDESVPRGRIVAGSLSNIPAARALQIICENTKQSLQQVGGTYVIKAPPAAGQPVPPTPAVPLVSPSPYSMMSTSPVEMTARDLSLREAVRRLVDQVPSPRYLLDFDDRTVPERLRVPDMAIAHQPFAQVMWMLLEPAGLTASVELPAAEGAATVIHIRAKTKLAAGATLPPPDPYSEYSKLSSALVDLDVQDVPLQDMLQKLADQAGAGRYAIDLHRAVPRELRVIQARIHGQPFNRALRMLLDQAGLTAVVDQPSTTAGAAQVIHISPKPTLVVVGPGTWPWVTVGDFPFGSRAALDQMRGREISKARIAEWNRQLIALGVARDWQACTKCGVLLNPAWQFCPFDAQPAPQPKTNVKAAPAPKP